MNAEIKKKLNELLKNNKKWPIIIEGISAEDFKNATILPAIILSEELSLVEGLPIWAQSLEKKAGLKTNVLVIDGIDVISIDEQKKFKAMLETQGLNGYKFPENVQIVLTIGRGNRNKVNTIMQSLCLYFNV